MFKSSRIAVIVCFSLMIAFSFNYQIFRTFIKSQKSEFRKDLFINGSSETTELVFEKEKLYVNDSEIEWEDNNKELVIKGKYYDVVSIELNGDLATVTVIQDAKESSLFDNYFARRHESKDVVISFLKMCTGLNNCSVIKIENSFNYLFNEISFRYVSCRLSDFQASLVKPPRMS